MLKVSRSSSCSLKQRPIFRFRGCLRRPASTVTTTTRSLIPASSDDKGIVELFNQRVAAKSSFLSFSSTGLFGHPTLTSPHALISLSHATLVRAQKLTDRILASRDSKHELTKVVKRLDRLSDMLCGVIDLAELVRNAHPDRAWVNAANDAYESMCEFMNVLNTHVGLYEVLGAVLSDPSIVATLGPEAKKTALIFWHDFERSGIHLPPASRSKFVTLSSEILVLGREFLNNASTQRRPIKVKHSELEGLKESDQGMGVRLENQARFGDLIVYPHSFQAQMIMRSAPQEDVRRRLYVASNASNPEQVATLDRLLRKRGELARLVGATSYGHMSLDDKMARSPDHVNRFLETLAEYTKPAVQSACNALSSRKQDHLKLRDLPIVQAWDRDFYCTPEPPVPPIPLPPLTLGTVFMALSRLFRHLYGVTLRPTDTLPGEVWTKGVQKLEVVDEAAGIIGWIYTDLFSRRGKAGGAAHYTVRCSRRTDHDEEIGELTEEEAWAVRESIDFEAVKRHRLPNQEGVYQLPLVVLLCDFGLVGSTTLEWDQVMTLFHEMGHAMHSMLGRTEYQNVSGTRCATDFVELPSILMEHFLSSPAVLTLFDINSTRTLTRTGNHHEDPCHSIDTQSQIVLAMLDQAYHSSIVDDPNFDSTKELEALYNKHASIPFVEGTSFQTQFGHLYGYGATYYSYLFDRAIASRVWGNVFVGDPLSRSTGERYKNEVLRYGGGRDPWKMLAELLKMPQLESGDAEAMREVGRWRIEDEVSVAGRH